MSELTSELKSATPLPKVVDYEGCGETVRSPAEFVHATHLSVAYIVRGCRAPWHRVSIILPLSENMNKVWMIKI